MKIKVKYFDEKLPKIEQIAAGDWIDLRASETVTMLAGDFRMIHLGIAMELPEGYEAIIAPRSSMFKHTGCIQTNSIGVIDESYCGDEDEWMLPVWCMRSMTINKGDRICQFRIVKHQPEIEFETVQELGNKNRGGFGSTGKE